ncbi:glycine-rich domain-containing protein [Haloferula helveola]|uniref:Glycine-rich domain-containing protein n=1 Tax=Haloferula helveola TaxID=490095 RepID=A0ABM7RD58_9BACT|nr:glycine-rich domain-containing protein [Haloferula helveola]
MKPEGASLWRRIEDFRLDHPDASLPFTSRLAREQDWTHAFAARVIVEYKRFVFLALESGHPVTPSEAVDQAWHLHLTYTRSYWERFCGEVLGRELHHEPTQGGPVEGDKFEDWYSRTLQSYEETFVTAPPREIWPEPSVRFANPGSGRWVDSSRYWLVPRPRWLSRT